MTSEHTQKPDPNLQAGQRPQTWALAWLFLENERGCQHKPGFLQDPEKSYSFKILPQEVWGRGTHRKSEIASESLVGLMEGISLLKAISKDWRRWLLFQMWRQQQTTSRNVKCQSNMTPQKDHNNLPVNKPKDMGICNLSNKEFKIAILR